MTFDLGKRDKSRMIMIEIKGNGYSGGYPIHSMYQFYNFIQNGTWSILAYKGRCYGDPTGPLKIYYKEVTNDDGTTETRLMACLCPFLDANGNVVTSNDSQTLDISIQYSVSHLDKVTMTTGTSDPSSDDSITILQTITPVDAVPISNGGTGATSFTSNAILRYNGEKLVSTNNYVADSKLAIGSASAPTENFYVNGTSKITGASTLAGAVTMSSTATIAGITTITNATDTTAATNGALVVTGGVGISGSLRVYKAAYFGNNVSVTEVLSAGTSGTAATTNKLTIHGQSQFNGNAAITGTLNVSDAATVKTLTISDNEGHSHIQFSRNNGINYLHVPTGGQLGICIGDLSTNNCSFVVKNDMVYPYVTNTIGLGSTSYKWKHLYLGTGGLYTGGTIYPSTENSCNIGTASYIWKYMYGERYYAYDATNKYQGGSFYTANSAATSEQTTYLMLGNNTANGTAGNRTGRIRLYGKSSGYGEIIGPNTTSNYSIHLPTTPQSGTNYMAIGDSSGDAFKTTLLKPTESGATGVKGTWPGSMPSAGKVIWREAFTHSELNNDSGDIVFWMANHGTNEATLNVLIDGCFYQNGQDGFYKVLDENMIVTNYGTQNPENKIANPQAGQVYFKIIS